MYNIRQMVEKCPKLVELVLMDTHITYDSTSILSCPKIKVLEIIGSESWMEKGQEISLQQNLQLQTFENKNAHRRLLNSVPTEIENLTTVTPSTTQLRRFVPTKNRMIRDPPLCLEMFVLSRMLANSKTLTSLQIDLKNFTMSEGHVDAIIKLKIQSKQFCREYCVRIIRSLKNLTDLVLHSDRFAIFTIELPEMIEHGPNMQQLVFIGYRWMMARMDL